MAERSSSGPAIELLGARLQANGGGRRQHQQPRNWAWGVHRVSDAALAEDGKSGIGIGPWVRIYRARRAAGGDISGLGNDKREHRSQAGDWGPGLRTRG